MSNYYNWEALDSEHCTDGTVSLKEVTCRRISVPGITLTIGMFFDGTGNNVFNTDTRLLETCTSMDVGLNKEDAAACTQKLNKGSNGAGSYLNYYTNVHWLNMLYVKDTESINPDEKTFFQRAVYIQGVGTQKGKADSLFGMGTGALFEGVAEKVDEGIALIAEQIAAILRLSEGINFAIEKIQFDVFGFSRGAASARHFANRVRRQDKTIQAAISKGLEGRNQHGKPAGEVRFLGLFDTVCAVGSVTNLFNVHSGFNPGIELMLPSDAAEKVFQITAMHECRYNFSLNAVGEAWPELPLPGVHSDIGGGYNPSEQEYVFLTRPQYETVRTEMDNKDTAVYRRSAAEVPDLYAIPALAPLLPSGEVQVETWYDYLVNPNKRRAGITEKRVGAAVTLKRVVPNDWSKVSLRVMLDAALEAGLNFENILPKDDNLSLPEELIPLSDKAVEQGRAKRRGEKPQPFTRDETALLGKYIHCSANWNPVVYKDVWLDGKKVKAVYGAVKTTQVVGFVHRPNERWHRAIWNMEGKKA